RWSLALRKQSWLHLPAPLSRFCHNPFRHFPTLTREKHYDAPPLARSPGLRFPRRLHDFHVRGSAFFGAPTQGRIGGPRLPVRLLRGCVVVCWSHKPSGRSLPPQHGPLELLAFSSTGVSLHASAINKYRRSSNQNNTR